MYVSNRGKSFVRNILCLDPVIIIVLLGLVGCNVLNRRILQVEMECCGFLIVFQGLCKMRQNRRPESSNILLV
jgi:hypothetical protein